MDRTFGEWNRKATETLEGAESRFKDLAGQVRAAANGQSSQGPPGTVALEARPEKVKVLYARVLAALCLVDGRLDPREVEYLYVFMSRIGLGTDSREEVRRSLDVEETQPTDLVRLVEEVVAAVSDNKEEISVSIIKDMTQVSRADGAVLPPEE